MEPETEMYVSQNQHVWHEKNLAQFMHWAHEKATFEQVDRVRDHVSIAHHRHVPIRRRAYQWRSINLPEHKYFAWIWEDDCCVQGCQKCERGEGGWTFDWIGPWTCDCIIGDGVMTAEDIRRRWSNCEECDLPKPCESESELQHARDMASQWAEIAAYEEEKASLPEQLANQLEREVSRS